MQMEELARAKEELAELRSELQEREERHWQELEEQRAAFELLFEQQMKVNQGQIAALQQLLAKAEEEKDSKSPKAFDFEQEREQQTSFSLEKHSDSVETSSSEDRLVTLNARGTIFVVPQSTLMADSKSLFAEVCRGKSRPGAIFFSKNSEEALELFINRDPVVVRMMLNYLTYLQSGQSEHLDAFDFSGLNEFEKRMLELDAQYFHLETLSNQLQQ